ncbi:GSCOCG00010253001-RA-CDS [Cotesia congregata]|nr:GSCOCG00010253001-RA-CDS [Cotesia congregata]
MTSSVKVLPFDLIYQEMREKIMQGLMSVNTRYPGSSEDNPTVLQLALSRYDPELINYLLDNNVNVNMTSKSYEPALNLAIRSYSSDLVHRLLQIGADVNIQSVFEEPTYQYTTIHSAVSEEIKEIMEQLLKNQGSESIHLGDKGYFIAMGYENFNPYERVLDPGIDIIPIQNVLSPLHLAVDKSHLRVIKYLIDHGADVNAICDDKTPLYLAVENKNKEIVKLLIKNKAKVNIKTKPWPLVQLASNSSNYGILRVLLDAGADVNSISYGITALFKAVNSGDLPMTEFLINHGADPDAQNNSKHILQVAVKSEQPSLVNCLLNAGVDINFVSSNGLAVVDTPNASERIISPIKNYIVKLKAANFHLIGVNLDAVSGKEFDDFYRDCCNEVEALKQTIINGTSLSCYSVLHKSHQRLAIGLKNIDEDNFPVNSKLESMFPLYGKLVYHHLTRALERKKFVEKAGELLYEVFGRKLPDTFTREIFYYLNISDLKMMSKNV